MLPHSVAYLIERGFDPLLAASAFGLTGMLSVIGILAVGWLSDRFGRLRTATCSYISTIVGIIALMLVSVWPTLLLVYAFVLFFGLMQGARGPIIVALVARLFPGGGVGAIYGTLSLAMGLGAGLGSWLLRPALRVDRQLPRLVRARDRRRPARACHVLVVPSLREEKMATASVAAAQQPQCAKNTGSSAAARMWLVAPPKIICRSRLCV